MNKILFTIMLLFGFAFTAQSQILTYSKVILLNALDTVPQGKVWKVESALANCTSHCNASIVVNNENIYTYVYQTGVPSNSQKSAAAANPTSFPIWLPEGTTLNIGSNVKYISVIEFNQ